MTAYLKKNNGFTLVELLIVISIISILSVIGIIIFSNVQRNARDAKRVSDLNAIANALELYKSQNGTYPPVSGSCTIICSTAFPQFKTILAPYFSAGEVPCDPTRKGAGGDYWFYIYNSANSYEILASLEGQTQGTAEPSVTNCSQWSDVYNLILRNRQ